MLTWGVDQSHMVPNAQSCLLRQSSGHPFSLSVQLDTGCSARHRALGKPSLSNTELGSRGFAHRYLSIHHARSTGQPRQPHLGIQQQKERVVGSGVGPPLQHIRQEQELHREANSILRSLTRGAFLTLPGTGPLPSWPGHCLPGGPAPARRPAQFFSQQPDSQQSWKLVQPLENRKMLTCTDMSHSLFDLGIQLFTMI